ncbi:MAG TPA: cupin domain-containing protein [Planctomycetota bacterium]|nr:cupin domain-containing protein [Planctomycetota bacterium]
MSFFRKRVLDHTGSRADKGFKATLFESPRLLLGVNCLEPGQAQHLHSHGGQDKFYLVQQGAGRFTVGDDAFDAAEGDVVWAPADVPHGVVNSGTARLTLVIGIAPAPSAR